MPLVLQKTQFADVLRKLLDSESFYAHVPKDYTANLQFRQDMLEWCSENRLRQECLMSICSEDILFWWNCFLFTYDPRRIDKGLSPLLPFITYDYQDEAILEINRAIGHYDALTEKSRDMGASWINVGVFDYRFLFRFMETFLMVSRKEDLVDDTENPDALFWKIDFIHKYCPRWMTRGVERMKLHFHNTLQGTTIDGESTTGNMGRGGRRTAISLDEFAATERADGFSALYATQAATNCRLFNSTPIGTGNAYDVVSKMPGIKKIILHWSQHPDKSLGLYRVSESGKVEVLDQDWHDANPGYAFVLKPGGWKGLRSPYYDRECERTPVPSLIAQELDMDHRGSGAQFFDEDVLRKHIERNQLDAFITGELDYDMVTARPRQFTPSSKGRLKLWCNLDGQGQPPKGHTYTVGADVSEGTGATNSTLSIADATTGEKVGEYADSNTRPEEHAKLAIALAKWFGDALLIWEANGAGRAFGQAVEDLEYGNIWYRRNEDRTTKKASDFAGWWSGRVEKRRLLSQYQIALAKDQFINHSQIAVDECREYVFDGQGVEHSGALNSVDPSGARDNHGDRVIADALACFPIVEGVEGGGTDPDKDDQIPENSIAGRRHTAEQRAQERKYWVNT